MTKKIDYYGKNASYIHLKFGDARKMFFFTKEFRKKYKRFCESYECYYFEEPNKNKDDEFLSGFDVVETARALKIPVEIFYYNFTDTPAKNYDEIFDYLNNKKNHEKTIFED